MLVGEILKLLQLTITCNKSSTMDFLPASLLCKCYEYFCYCPNSESCVHSEGVFSNNLESTPVFENPRLVKCEPAIYQQISNSKTFGKLLKKLVLVCLQPHIITCSSFNDYLSLPVRLPCWSLDCYKAYWLNARTSALHYFYLASYRCCGSPFCPGITLDHQHRF